MTLIYCLTILEVKTLKWVSLGRATFLLEALKRNHFLVFSNFYKLSLFLDS